MKMKFILPKILEERGISKLQFSKDIGVSYPTIDNLCNGETQGIKFYILENICNVLNCMPNDLFEYTDINETTNKNENPVKWCEIQQSNQSPGASKKKYVYLDTKKYEHKQPTLFTDDDIRGLIQSSEVQKAMEDLLLSIIHDNNKDDTE